MALVLGFLAELGDLGDGAFATAAREVGLVALFLAAVHASTGRPGAALVRWAGLAAIVARVAAQLPGLSSETDSLLTGIGALFLVLATGVLLVHLLRSRKVDADLLVGSLCIYLLLGFVWALAYRALGDPAAAFRTPTGEPAGVHDLVYFSFVTLTTLGYGDVQPASAAAKGLAVAEAVAGQFYLAILVARLLGLHLAAARDRA